MFPVPHFSKALDIIADEKNITKHFKSVLSKVDKDNRRATFRHFNTGEETTHDFDLLHIVPPQTAHQFMRESPLADQTGFMECDNYTLQHPVYKNCFALGDVAGTPASKTAAAIYAQAPVIQHQIWADMKGKASTAKYDGYSSCPVYTGDNKLMLMEFKYGGEPDMTFLPN